MKILDEFSGSPVNLKRQGTDLEGKEANLCKKQKSQIRKVDDGDMDSDDEQAG